MFKTLPIVTIGVPVYNSDETLVSALDSLINQTFHEIAIVISDNGSTDRTEKICREYASKDSRISYIRQPKNIGAESNFKFVLDLARTKYFMWAASDDIRSLNFIEKNIEFLEINSEYLGSTSPVRFQGREFNQFAMGDSALNHDDPCERVSEIFRCWHANGRFYSLFRREDVTSWPNLNKAHFLGSDWTLITHLASRGKLNRISEGWVELGVNGISHSSDIFARYRTTLFDWFLPFNKLSMDAISHTSNGGVRCKMQLITRLLILNWQAFRGQFYSMLSFCKATK
jgi:glycosyltransferase involved in cell wall biosynthesis